MVAVYNQLLLAARRIGDTHIQILLAWHGYSLGAGTNESDNAILAGAFQKKSTIILLKRSGHNLQLSLTSLSKCVMGKKE